MNSRRLAFPKIVNPGVPPVRPERHITNSIATMRRHLIVALATTLTECPCCAATHRAKPLTPIQFYDAVRLDGLWLSSFFGSVGSQLSKLPNVTVHTTSPY